MIRATQIVEKGQIHLQLPEQLWDKEVEILVSPLQQKSLTTGPKKSLRGCLQEYANIPLMSQEKDAWADAVVEKYGHH
ncbi:MAG: hypothetical protein CSA81_14470 [Acidobacteria bacterium]|nr:MAG: hypothetical protein CSA81_14470 [Acidobacteriota bacterium]